MEKYLDFKSSDVHKSSLRLSSASGIIWNSLFRNDQDFWSAYVL